jgi:transposase-like protein
MTARKLSESDKQKILELYRQTSETSSSLASRYGVSTSTVSRILKSNLSEEEYESLIQQKRGNRLNETTTVELPVSEETTAPPSETDDVPPVEAPVSGGRRSRKRSSALVEPLQPSLLEEISTEGVPQEEMAPIVEIAEEVISASKADTEYTAEASVIQEMLGEELLDQEEEEEDLDDEDLEDDDLDDELDTNLEESALLMGTKIQGKMLVQVLPLTEASLPRTCYLVVDRSAELIARPLSDFGDLGQIPEAEIQEKTLPIFDNHRIAKRYSNPRTQRVIKLPDGKVLQKTSSHLQAKGITRLLIDGQVYSLN